MADVYLTVVPWRQHICLHDCEKRFGLRYLGTRLAKLYIISVHCIPLHANLPIKIHHHDSAVIGTLQLQQ